MSDCDAVTDIYQGHNYTPGQPEASALSLLHGMDNECADFFAKRTDDKDYRPFLDAVKQGLLKESDIDTTVDSALYRAHEAGHVRSAGDGSVLEDR